MTLDTSVVVVLGPGSKKGRCVWSKPLSKAVSWDVIP